MKLVVAGAIVMAAFACVTAVLIVVITHGGFTGPNTNALGILVALIGSTSIPSLISLFVTAKLHDNVTNGLIPQKITEGLAQPEAQKLITQAANAENGAQASDHKETGN